MNGSDNMNGLEGAVLAGKYRVLRLIGRGGMANVYLASDLASGMNVAIKVLKLEYAADEEFIKRFENEARAVSSLSHANIVKVITVGHEGDYRYIVQEYVDGITVKELINQNGHLDWRVAVPIAIQVGVALEYAHRNGIVHRDIKPQNILITRDRIAKVTDFGIARAVSTNTITMSSGGAIGSVHYFSPEQARGGNVGPASDIYSMGAMLFEMVTGRVPYDGQSNIEIAVKHLQEKPPVASNYVPDVPNGLDAIINKCMQKTPERRYSSMGQMVTELDALMVDPNGVYGVITAPENDEGNINLSFRQDPSYGKVKELEGSIERRRRARFRDNIILVVIILVIVGVLVGLGTLIITTARNVTNIEKNTDYTVPNFVGLTIDECTEELERNNITYDTVTEVTSDYTPGTVIAQSINEGVVISAGSSTHKITLTVAAAEETITLQDYSGVDYMQAFVMINQLNLQATVRSEVSETVDENLVIRTEPAAGSQVTEGDPVVIVYAVKPTSSTIPSVVGHTLEDARQMLSDADILIGSIEGSEEVKALPESQQYVMSTNPVAGTAVPRMSTIMVYVGTAEDYARGGTPTPTPSSINVTTGVTGSGTVTGGGPYTPGTTVTLEATPAEGFSFTCWQDAYGNIVAYSQTYTFVVAENTTPSYTAVFTANATPTPTETQPSETESSETSN